MNLELKPTQLSRIPSSCMASDIESTNFSSESTYRQMSTNENHGYSGKTDVEHGSCNGPSKLLGVEYSLLAPTATSYNFVNPDIRRLVQRDENSSHLLEAYGGTTYRTMMRVWAEVFWVLSLPVLFVTTLLLSGARFLLETMIRPVLIGPLVLLGDHLFKPFVVVLHDTFFLPSYTLCANNMTALLMVVQLVGRMLEVLVRPLATLLSSFRLVQINYGPPPPGPAHVV